MVQSLLLSLLRAIQECKRLHGSDSRIVSSLQTREKRVAEGR